MKPVERPSSFWLSLTRARFDALRPTMYTGNFTFPANTNPWEPLGERYGPMVGRHMRDLGSGLTAIICFSRLYCDRTTHVALFNFTKSRRMGFQRRPPR